MRLIFIALSASCALAQSVFDVASVKEVKDFQPGTLSEKIVANPGFLSMRSVRLRACITWAYEVKDFQIAGPSWLGAPYWGGRDLSRYEIVARAPANTPVSEMRLMLRRLLADRFKLVLHREKKEQPVFVLTFVNNGSDLKASADQNAERQIVPGPDGLRFLNAPLAEFADFLSGPLHVPVFDRTGLAGRFDIFLKDPSGTPDDQIAALPDSVRQQLGLKLERRKEVVEMLIIDSAEKKPVEN